MAKFDSFVFRFSEVFYIDATNESMLRADLEALSPHDTTMSAEEVLRWLSAQSSKKPLFVLDNADDVNLNLKPFLPAIGNIIITTRNQQLYKYASGNSFIKVGNMDPQEAVDLLLAQAKMEKTVESEAQANMVVQVMFTIVIQITQ